MTIERIHKNGNDAYSFKINGSLILKITGTAISVLGIKLPSFGIESDFYDAVEKQLDIEKMASDILSKNKADSIVIDSKVCRANGEIVYQIEELKKFVKECL